MHCDALAVTSDEILAVPNERQSRFGGIRELGIPGAQIKRGRLHEMNHNILGDTRLLRESIHRKMSQSYGHFPYLP